MTVEKRLEELLLALQFDSQVSKRLTAFDRMLINQERASLLSADPTVSPRPVPQKVELKIIALLAECRAQNFEPHENKY